MSLTSRSRIFQILQKQRLAGGHVVKALKRAAGPPSARGRLARGERRGETENRRDRRTISILLEQKVCSIMFLRRMSMMNAMRGEALGM